MKIMVAEINVLARTLKKKKVSRAIHQVLLTGNSILNTTWYFKHLSSSNNWVLEKHLNRKNWFCRKDFIL